MESKKSNQRDGTNMEAILDVVISHLQEPANLSLEELFQKAAYCESKRQEVIAQIEGLKTPKGKRTERKLLKQHFMWMVSGHTYETEIAKRTLRQGSL